MKTQHTPGEWRKVRLGNRLYVESDKGFICDMQLEEADTDFQRTRTEEDATLICAAPDLLEACKQLRAAAINTPALDSSEDWTALIEVADAAIAKAMRGERFSK